MKKQIRLNRFLALILLLSAYFFITNISGIFAMGKRPQNNVFKVGITQIIEHPGIDLVRKGFLHGMKENGFIEGQNIEYDFQNAQGQMPVAADIAKKFVNDKVNLIFAITTPSAQAVVKAARGTSIPIVFGAVTDPVQAGIVNSFDRPGGNVTGTSDILPIKAQFELLLKIVPHVKKIGVVFNPGESNAYFLMQVMEKAAKDLGVNLVKAPVSNTNDVLQATRSLVGRCDALYTGASNTVSGAIESVVKVSEASKLPLLVASSSDVAKGGFGTVGFDYFDVGTKSADLAAEILLHNKNAGDIPVAKITNYQYFFNLHSAEASGVSIPKELINKAAKVYK